MQDWITDSHKRLTILLMSITLLVSACATSSMRSGEANVTVMGTNYTEDYIEFTLMSPSGKNLGTGGSVEPFSKGGTGGGVCCAMVPGVGQTVRVELRVGGFNDAADQYKTYSRDVVVKGTMPKPEYKLQSVLIVRFFPNHEVEAELLPGDGDFGPANSRMDRLFFAGPRVMRHKGE